MSWVESKYTRVPTFLSSVERWLALVFAALGVFIAFVPWAQTSFGTGKVVAWFPSQRTQAIDAPIDGRVTKWHVVEGSRVKKGELIVEISDIDAENVSRIQNEVRAVRFRSKAIDQALQAARSNFERQKALVQQGLSSVRLMELAEIEVSRLGSERASLDAELARTEGKLARQGVQSVLAPLDGMIQRIAIPEGGSLFKAGARLGVLIPDTEERAVEVWVRGNDVPLIRAGRQVRLQFEGWPALQFSGWPSVAVGTFSGKVQFIDPIDNGRGEFRVVVLPESESSWPSGQYLRQGVRAHAWILLDTVSVGYELWRQFNGFPPSIQPDDQEKK